MEMTAKMIKGQELLEVVVEIPRGSRYKYELRRSHMGTKQTLHMDRMLRKASLHNYGMVPGTLAGDGDPLDVFVISEEPMAPETHVKVEVVGMLVCFDQGEEDNKLLARIPGDPYADDDRVQEEAKHIQTYLEHYKPGFVVAGQATLTEALKAVSSSQINYDLGPEPPLGL